MRRINRGIVIVAAMAMLTGLAGCEVFDGDGWGGDGHTCEWNNPFFNWGANNNYSNDNEGGSHHNDDHDCDTGHDHDHDGDHDYDHDGDHNNDCDTDGNHDHR